MGISNQIELRHLRCMVVLAEELSFRRAAERLHMTQPPLSRTVAQMEELVGGRLFDRSRSHCRLTALGKVVAADAARILGDLDRRMALWSDMPSVSDPVLRLGLFFALSPRYFGELAQAFQARQKDARLELAVDRSHLLVGQVLKRKLHAALIMLPAATAHLPVLRLGEADMVALLPADSVLARKSVVRLSELDQFDTFLFMRERENPPLYRYLDDAVRARGLQRPKYFVPKDTFAGLARVAAGQACTIVCEAMADSTRGDLAFRSLPRDERIRTELALVHDPAIPPPILAALHESAMLYLEKVLGRPARRRA